MNKMKLGDILKIKHGYAFKGENFSDEGEFILLTPANFYESGGFKYTPGKEKYYLGDFPQEYLCKKGDLIVAMTQQAEGLLGSTAIVPEDNIYLHNQRIGLITVDETKADKKFVDYLFRTKNVRFQIEGSSSGTKVKHTSPDKIYDVDVWLPDLDNQRKIGEILSTIDETIRKNNNINQELDEIAQAIYQYWFVQFEFPNEEGKPYKSSGGEMVWNEELKREIPAGWEVKILGDECSTFLGGTPSRKKPEYWNGDINWINSGALNDSRIFKSSEKVTKEAVGNSATKLLPSGTTVISITGNIMISLLEIEACTNQSVVGVVENKNMPKEFVYFMCKNNKRYYESLMSGAVQQHINKEIIDNTKFIAPYGEVMKCYSKIAEPLFEEIKNNNQQNQELIKLRDFLLPLLMNGQAKLN